jgi:hypothetical protein
MGCLEGCGVPVLYIGRTVPKGLIVNLASSLSSTLEVISHVQVTETNSAWIFQRRIHKQTSVNCNSLVK